MINVSINRQETIQRDSALRTTLKDCKVPQVVRGSQKWGNAEMAEVNANIERMVAEGLRVIGVSATDVATMDLNLPLLPPAGITEAHSLLEVRTRLGDSSR